MSLSQNRFSYFKKKDIATIFEIRRNLYVSLALNLKFHGNYLKMLILMKKVSTNDLVLEKASILDAISSVSTCDILA